MRNALVLLVLLGATAPAAAVPIFPLSVFPAPVFEEGFDAYAGTGLAPAPTAGALDSRRWRIAGLSDGDTVFGGTYHAGDFARGLSSGGVATGGLYGFEIGAGRALGIQSTGADATPGALDLRVPGALLAPADAVTLSYVLRYRDDGARSSDVRVSAGPSDDDLTELSALATTTPHGATPGADWTGVALSATLPAHAIEAGEDLIVRWFFDDASGSGARDEIAIDDVSVAIFGAALPVSEPHAIALAAGGVLALAASRRRRPRRPVAPAP